MRKIIAIILAFVLCFCSVCVYADTNEKFTIRVDSKEVKVGETIELNINIEDLFIPKGYIFGTSTSHEIDKIVLLVKKIMF